MVHKTKACKLLTEIQHESEINVCSSVVVWLLNVSQTRKKEEQKSTLLKKETD